MSTFFTSSWNSSESCLPSCLHYLQLESRRFDLDHQLWEIEKAQLNERLSELETRYHSAKFSFQDLIVQLHLLQTVLQSERTPFPVNELASIRDVSTLDAMKEWKSIKKRLLSRSLLEKFLKRLDSMSPFSFLTSSPSSCILCPSSCTTTTTTTTTSTNTISPNSLLNSFQDDSLSLLFF